MKLTLSQKQKYADIGLSFLCFYAANKKRLSLERAVSIFIKFK